MNSERLEELLALFIELQDAGEEITIDQFMLDHDSDDKELRETLKALIETESMFNPNALGQLKCIGPYRLIRQIGRGGMGMVFEAEKEAGRRVAVKLLDLAAHMNPRAIKRLKREGEILRRLQHPHIVQILEAGEERGSPYLVMELLDGESLADIQKKAAAKGLRPTEYLAECADKKEKEPWMHAVLLVSKLAQAMEHAHAVGLLHRDIKPSNVMLDAAGEPTLLDFGLARDQEASTLTHTGDLLGTPVYMAPEQAVGEPSTPATDVYGLGALLFELLTGRPVVASRDPLKILELVAKGDISTLRSVWPEANKKLDAIVTTATAREPGSRYFSAAAFAEDLAAVVEDRSVNARRSAFLGRAVWRRRLKAVGAAVLVLVVVTVIVLWPEKKAPAPVVSREAEIQEEAMSAWVAGKDEVAVLLAEESRRLKDRSDMTRFLDACISQQEFPAFESPAAVKLAAGEMARRRKDLGKAIKFSLEAIELAPESPVPGLFVAKLALDDRRFDLAERELEFAKRRFPENSALLTMLARVQSERREFESSAKQFRTALEKDPENRKTWYRLARSLYFAGRFEEGLKVAREAYTRFGKKGAKGLYILAGLLDKNKRPQEAQAVLREILAENPGDRRARFNLAYSLDSVHKSVEAAELLEENLKLNPDDVRSMILVANIYAGADRDHCRECAKNYRDHPELYQPARAAALAEKIIEVEKGKVLLHAELAVSFARKAGAGEEMKLVLDRVSRELTRDAESGQEVADQIANLERARLKLDGKEGED